MAIAGQEYRGGAHHRAPAAGRELYPRPRARTCRPEHAQRNDLENAFVETIYRKGGVALIRLLDD
jgi:hypothetical protein